MALAGVILNSDSLKVREAPMAPPPVPATGVPAAFDDEDDEEDEPQPATANPATTTTSAANRVMRVRTPADGKTFPARFGIRR